MIFIRFAPNGQKRATDLQDAFWGQTAVLVGDAPSLKEQNVELLNQRGVLTMAMNNAALHFRPTLWVSGDRPECYEPQILLDPRIVKFGIMAHAETQMDGKYNGLRYRQMPNMFFYLPESDVPWDEYLSPRRGVPWYNNTLFVAIHILYQLGIRRIILAGSDFGFAKHAKQDMHKGDMYAHKTQLGSLERKWNLDLYNSLVRELRRLKPVFDRAGLTLMDCSKYSRIAQVYPHITLDAAVQMCLEQFPKQLLDPALLPHCSKFASEAIQERIARWPGYQVVGAPAPAPAQAAQVKPVTHKTGAKHVL